MKLVKVLGLAVVLSTGLAGCAENGGFLDANARIGIPRGETPRGDAGHHDNGRHEGEHRRHHREDDDD